MELMYAYRESVEVANTKLVDLEKSKVSVSKISSKDSRYRCISQTGFASFDTETKIFSHITSLRGLFTQIIKVYSP